MHCTQTIYHRVSFQKLAKHVHYVTGLGDSVQDALQGVQATAVDIWSCCCSYLAGQLGTYQACKEHALKEHTCLSSHKKVLSKSCLVISKLFPTLALESEQLYTAPYKAVQSCADSKANLVFS